MPEFTSNTDGSVTVHMGPLDQAYMEQYLIKLEERLAPLQPDFTEFNNKVESLSDDKQAEFWLWWANNTDAGSDYCSVCGADWKQPHREQCPRLFMELLNKFLGR